MGTGHRAGPRPRPPGILLRAPEQQPTVPADRRLDPAHAVHAARPAGHLPPEPAARQRAGPLRLQGGGGEGAEVPAHVSARPARAPRGAAAPVRRAPGASSRGPRPALTAAPRPPGVCWGTPRSSPSSPVRRRSAVSLHKVSPWPPPPPGSPWALARAGWAPSTAPTPSPATGTVLGCRGPAVETFPALPSGGARTTPRACGAPRAAATPPPSTLFSPSTTWAGAGSPCDRSAQTHAVTSRRGGQGHAAGPAACRRGARGDSPPLHVFHFVFPRTYQFEYLNHAGRYYNVKASVHTPRSAHVLSTPCARRVQPSGPSPLAAAPPFFFIANYFWADNV